MYKEIVQHGDVVLRKTAREVPAELIGGKTLEQEIQALRDTLRLEYDGVAIAAPQIGISRRMFIVSGRVFVDHPSQEPVADMVCINPEIVKTSSKMKPMDEGCLSVRYVYGQVKRYTNVTIAYTDEHGNRITRGAGGLLAHIFQHEIDHLDGTLFIDKAERIEELKGRDRTELDRQRQQYINSLPQHD